MAVSRSCSTRTITPISTLPITTCSPRSANTQVGGSWTIGERVKTSAQATKVCQRIGASIPHANEHSLSASDRLRGVRTMEDTDKPIVFGAPYSVYVRAVRLELEEKGCPLRTCPD